MIGHVVLRVARPTDDLEALLPFYVGGLGFEILFRFEHHDGFDGVMVGDAHSAYHLEFTARTSGEAHTVPDGEQLLVFYVPDAVEWKRGCERLAAAGFEPVASANPYWDRKGRTFKDIDGNRIVLQHDAWTR